MCADTLTNQNETLIHSRISPDFNQRIFFIRREKWQSSFSRRISRGTIPRSLPDLSSQCVDADSLWLSAIYLCFIFVRRSNICHYNLFRHVTMTSNFRRRLLPRLLFVMTDCLTLFGDKHNWNLLRRMGFVLSVPVGFILYTILSISTLSKEIGWNYRHWLIIDVKTN